MKAITSEMGMKKVGIVELLISRGIAAVVGL
jgi:hypothetical protein